MHGRHFVDSLYRRWLEIKKPVPGSFSGVDETGYYYLLDPDSGRRVFVSHPRRLAYYGSGVPARVDQLASEYGVVGFELYPDDQVVDVGAHSGEFGLWVERLAHNILP